MSDRRHLHLCCLAALLAGCVAPPTEAPLAQLPDRVTTAHAAPDAAPDAASLVLTVTAAPAAGYRTQFVRWLDWEVAEASLTNADGTIPALNRSVPASVSASLARTASLYFAPIKPAANYTLSINLKRRDRTGTYQTVASGTRNALTLSPGPNAAAVTLSATASGEVTINAPQPVLVAPTPPEITGLVPASVSVGMAFDAQGVHFSPTPGENALTLNGGALTLESVTSTRLTALVPVGAATGTVAVTVAGRAASSPTQLTVVASGTSLGSTGVGANPWGIAKDAGGNLWVANASGTTVTKLGPDGTYLNAFAAGTAPIGVAVDGSGTIWVLNYTNPGRVTRLAPDGTILGTTTVGSYPLEIEFDSGGNAWVANSGDNTVSKLTPGGTVIGSYNVGVPPSEATGLSIDGADNVWVCVHSRNKVVKLASGGGQLDSYNVGSTPKSCAFDGAGNLWVTLAGAHAVQKLSPAGAVLATYGLGAGSAPHALMWGPDGNMWIGCPGIDSVVRMSPEGTVLGTMAVGGDPNGIVFDRYRAANVATGTVNAVQRLAL